MLLDANILLLATDESSPMHAAAYDWLNSRMNGSSRIGFPWATLTAFLRIATNPRVYPNPLSSEDAWDLVAGWIHASPAWIPQPTDAHADVLGGLIRKYQLTANLIPDAHLAALAVEHGVEIVSADTDFARFTEVRWINPLAA